MPLSANRSAQKGQGYLMFALFFHNHLTVNSNSMTVSGTIEQYGQGDNAARKLFTWKGREGIHVPGLQGPCLQCNYETFLAACLIRFLHEKACQHHTGEGISMMRDVVLYHEQRSGQTCP